MARKPKPRKNPIVNKMYVWELEVEGRTVEWKCFVGENECITYEGDRECKHLKIMDKTQMEGLLQIDCETRVWDQILPFQLENGIPYIKVEQENGTKKWTMSDTTKEDRLQQQIRNVKLQAYWSFGVGVLMFLIWGVQTLVAGGMEAWAMTPAIGVMCLAAGGMNLVRLRGELQEMGRPFSFKLDETK